MLDSIEDEEEGKISFWKYPLINIAIQTTLTLVITYFYYCWTWYNVDYAILFVLTILVNIGFLIFLMRETIYTELNSLTLFTCTILLLSFFAAKKIINSKYESYQLDPLFALAQETDGYLTYEIFFKKDGTFYSIQSGLERNVYGTYEIDQKIIVLSRSYDPYDDLCDKYLIVSKKRNMFLQPVTCKKKGLENETIWFYYR